MSGGWKGRRIFISFDGVDAGFFIWVNGEKVGCGVNSRNAVEFDLTKYIRPGKMYWRWKCTGITTGSYLEDQDMWRLSGIFRNVTLVEQSATTYPDFFIRAGIENAQQ